MSLPSDDKRAEKFTIDECEEAFVREFCPYKGSPDPLIVWRSAWASAYSAGQRAAAVWAAQVCEHLVGLIDGADELACAIRREFGIDGEQGNG